jgi:hypothetical protein
METNMDPTYTAPRSILEGQESATGRLDTIV